LYSKTVRVSTKTTLSLGIKDDMMEKYGEKLTNMCRGRERWMEITKEDKRSVIDHCYLTYFISGMVILIFGVILPNLIEERTLPRPADCFPFWRSEIYVQVWHIRYSVG